MLYFKLNKMYFHLENIFFEVILIIFLFLHVNVDKLVNTKEEQIQFKFVIFNKLICAFTIELFINATMEVFCKLHCDIIDELILL